ASSAAGTEATQDLVYTPAPAAVTGRVLDADGAGIGGIQVDVEYYATAADDYVYTSTTTAADGTYSVSAPGDVTYLEARGEAANGWAPLDSNWHDGDPTTL